MISIQFAFFKCSVVIGKYSMEMKLELCWVGGSSKFIPNYWPKMFHEGIFISSRQPFHQKCFNRLQKKKEFLLRWVIIDLCIGYDIFSHIGRLNGQIHAKFAWTF